jgi:hypothetical protein
MTVPTYDYDQRHWRKIYGPEEISKIGELLTGVPAEQIIPVDDRPTVKVRIQNRPSTLKAASVRYHNEDRAEKVLRLLTGNI